MKEFYNKNFSDWKKIIRFIAILFIPFGYAFIYMFGFSNQLSHIDNLDLRVVVQKNDQFAMDFSKQLQSMKSPIKFGNLSFNIKINNAAPANEIYLNTTNRKDFDKEAQQNSDKGYATLAMSPSLTEFVGTHIYNIIENLDVRNATKVFNNLLADIKSQHLFTFYLNYNVDPGVAFSISAATTMTPIYTQVLTGLFSTDPQSIINVSKNKPDFIKFSNTAKQIWTTAKKMTNNDVQSSGLLNNLSFVNTHTNLPRNSNFSWLIAPFFLIIGMWLGGISLMMIVSKQKRKNISAIANYFLQSSFLLLTSTIQATILVLSLYLLGFQIFGINMLYLFITTIIISIPLILLIQGIRFIIPNKNFSILVFLILLILQMATIGGIFGVHTTNSFYRIIGYVMPITYAIKLINISLYYFVWTSFFINLSYLLLLSIVIISPCIFIYTKQYNKKTINEVRHV